MIVEEFDEPCFMFNLSLSHPLTIVHASPNAAQLAAIPRATPDR